MNESAKVDKMIARTAGRQFGVVTRAQLTDAGLSRHALRRRLQAGRLLPLGRHVFGIPGVPSSWERDALAACLDHGPLALLSHRSAAVVWQLCPATGNEIDVTVPYPLSGRGSSPAVTVHRSRSLARPDRVVVRKLPVTAIGRTLVDVASIGDVELLRTSANQALGRRLISPAALSATLDRLDGGGRRGRSHLRRILAPWIAGHEVESIAEADVLRAVRLDGLPEPATQLEVWTPEGEFVARVDFAWPDRRVALEVDGFRWHANPAAQVADVARANRLAALGWIVLRTTPAEMASDKDQVLAAIRRHLGLTA